MNNELIGDRHDRSLYSAYSLLLMGVLAWVLLLSGVRTWAEANLDPYGDMLECWIWGQTWSWGTYKHPPLMNWVAHLWFSLWPMGTGAYKLLAYVTAAIGLLGLLELARLHGLRKWLWVVLVAAICGFPTTVLSAKYNANLILIPIWPWVAVAWTQSFVLRKGTGWAVALGILSALSILAKYYSGVMLLGLFLSSLFSQKGRRWYVTPYPWIALLVFCVSLIPHLKWQMEQHWVSLHYVEEQGTGRVALTELWHFTLSPVIYWGLAWIATTALMRGKHSSRASFLYRLALCWKPKGWDDTLFWLAFAPWFISLMFGISSFVDLSIPWAIPIGYAYPALWVRNLSELTEEDVPARIEIRAKKVFIYLLVGLLIFGIWLGRHNMASRDRRYFMPREESAAAILQSWQGRHFGVPLRWVGGEWPENGLVGFYGDQSLFTLPGTPDDPRAQINLQPGLVREGGILLCRGGWLPDGVTIDQVAATDWRRYLAQPCAVQARNWLLQHGQRSAEPRLVPAQKHGPAFPHAPVYAYLIYEYLP